MTSLNLSFKNQRFLIREYDGQRDLAMVEKLERSCEVGSVGGFCILTNMMGDPLCRIRHYTLHLILVAELDDSREIVGVVRGCMKRVGTGKVATHVNMGCILGLRVSPKHRRNGIGLSLVRCIEGWLKENGAEYLSVATDEKNMASINLFTQRCNYERLSSLVISAQLLHPHSKKEQTHNIKIVKLSNNQATLLYRESCDANLIPVDIDLMFRQRFNLGTWVSHFADEQWDALYKTELDSEFIMSAPSSWAIISIWKTCEVYKLQVVAPPPLRCFLSVLGRMRTKVFPCLSLPKSCDLLHKPFGFFFIYGIHGKGRNMGELVEALWWFSHNLAGNEKDCKAIVTELVTCDPIREYIPHEATKYQVDDLWLWKKVEGNVTGEDAISCSMMCPIERIFVDPRDF